jgi:translation initiation factor 1
MSERYPQPSGLFHGRRAYRSSRKPKRLNGRKATALCAFSGRPAGAKGKGVSLITGLDLDDEAICIKLAAELKKKCGCGGAAERGGY